MPARPGRLVDRFAGALAYGLRRRAAWTGSMILMRAIRGAAAPV